MRATFISKLTIAFDNIHVYLKYLVTYYDRHCISLGLIDFFMRKKHLKIEFFVFNIFALILFSITLLELIYVFQMFN